MSQTRRRGPGALVHTCCGTSIPASANTAPLATSAHTAWRTLESENDTDLFLKTGGLLVGSVGSRTLAAAAKAATGTAHHRLSAAEMRTAFPALHFADDTEGLLDQEAGILLAEPSVRAFRRQAERAGAELCFGADVDLHSVLTRWRSDHAVIGGGRRIGADILVLALGPWLRSLPAGSRWPRVSVERALSHWLDPAEHRTALAPDRTPFVTCSDTHGDFHMQPALAGGVRVESHSNGESADPDKGPRAVDEAECQAAQTRLAELAGLKPAHRAARVQMRTTTRDGQFAVTRHPWAEDVVIISACSGTDFAFAPVIADRVAVTVGT
ncbi:FAD-dependent oxidoreductase [Streptomyces sp. NPDC090106]|uniref:FAD-dependent oxidoreductase n=1 Tax=Streptomyces sp. NPDC090106 TaxID=3365946 RepID=UPI00381C55AD